MRTIILFSLLTALVTGCAGGGGSTVTPPSNNPHTYTVTDIGAQAFPAALNDSGVVVGQMNGQAFAYSGGAVHMLGMLPGGATSAAAAINDTGTIVGTTYFAGSSRFEATLFSLTGPPQPLGTGDGSDSTAVGVNAAGEIVGTVLSAPGCLGRVAIFDGHGNATEFADNALAIAVNNSGTILYETATPSAVVSCGTSPAAYLYPANTAVPYPANIDTGNGIPNVAALDNLGDVAGNYNDTSGNGALFLYHNGSSNELSMPGFANLSAQGMNDAGWIVGEYNNRPPMDSSAFLYANGTAINLQSLLSASDSAAWTLLSAQAVNDRGVIAANSQTASAVQHGVLLQPSP